MNFQKVVCHIQGFSLKVLMGRTLAAVPCVLRASGCSPVRPLRSWYTYFQLKMNIFNTHTQPHRAGSASDRRSRETATLATLTMKGRWRIDEGINEGSMKDRWMDQWRVDEVSMKEWWRIDEGINEGSMKGRWRIDEGINEGSMKDRWRDQWRVDEGSMNQIEKTNKERKQKTQRSNLI